MRKNARGLRFAEQTFTNPLPLSRVRELGEVNGFDRNGTPDRRVERLVNDSHAATAQLLEQLIAAGLIHDLQYSGAPKTPKWLRIQSQTTRRRQLLR